MAVDGQTTLVFFERGAGRVRLSYYDSEGRLVKEQLIDNVKSIEFKGVDLRSFQGMHHKLTLYVVDCAVSIEAKGSILTIVCRGGE